MTMTSHPSTPTLETVYARFIRVTATLAGRDPEEDLATFGELLLLRDHLFERLELPITEHNSLRLYDYAEAGLPLQALLSDVDHFFPQSVVDDEGLMLSALATYFRWRRVDTRHARLYDVLAFLGVPYHSHNVAAATAWLDGVLAYPTLKALLARDDAQLDAAIC